MRLGIFGGSFDPPHVGHLLVAQDAGTALGLDRLVIVPSHQQPLKQGQQTAATHRLEMARRCFHGIADVEVSTVEVDRGGLSFTVDTVATLQACTPRAELYLLIGRDALRSFSQWQEPERLRSMVRVVVLGRGDERADQAPTLPSWPKDALAPLVHLATRRVDVSSTEIRARVQSGRSIRGFVTDDVAEYIALTGLYLRDPLAEHGTAHA